MECRLCDNIIEDNALFGVCFKDIEKLTTGAVKDKQRKEAAEKAAKEAGEEPAPTPEGEPTAA